MENEIDLTGVDPARWPEIRRRVAVLDEYIAIWRPDAETRQAYADRLDISASNLLTLARIWRKDRSAAALPGAKVKDRVQKGPRLDARVIEIAKAVIAEMGPMARRKDVVAEVTLRCDTDGLTPPSSSSLSYMMMAARGCADTTDVEPEILIAECVLKIPVQHDGGVAMPRVLLAMLLPERHILASDIAFDPASPTSLTKVLEGIEGAETPGAPLLPLRAPNRSRLEREIIGAVSTAEGTGKPTLARMLGPQLGDIPVSYKAATVLSAGKLLAARHSAAIGPDDATRAIMEAIDKHNDRMPSPSTAGFTTGVHTRQSSELAATL